MLRISDQNASAEKAGVPPLSSRTRFSASIAAVELEINDDANCTCAAMRSRREASRIVRSSCRFIALPRTTGRRGGRDRRAGGLLVPREQGPVFGLEPVEFGDLAGVALAGGPLDTRERAMDDPLLTFLDLSKRWQRVYASEEFRRRLQIAAIERGMKVQGLIDAAVDAYLEADAREGGSSTGRAARPFASLTAAETKFIEEMLGFFRNADAASIKLVRQHAAAIAELRASRGSLRRAG